MGFRGHVWHPGLPERSPAMTDNAGAGESLPAGYPMRNTGDVARGKRGGDGSRQGGRCQQWLRGVSGPQPGLPWRRTLTTLTALHVGWSRDSSWEKGTGHVLGLSIVLLSEGHCDKGLCTGWPGPKAYSPHFWGWRSKTRVLAEQGPSATCGEDPCGPSDPCPTHTPLQPLRLPGLPQASLLHEAPPLLALG